MITLEKLLEKLTEQINQVNNDGSYGYNFNLVLDTGEYKPPTRIDNTVIEYVNGVFSLLNSDVVTLSGGYKYATQTCQLKVEISLPNHQEDREYNNVIYEGSDTVIKKMRSFFDTLASQSKQFPLIVREGNKEITYVVSVVYSYATSDNRAQAPQDGDSYVFSLIAYYSFVENGVNSQDFTFLFDGYLFPYESMTINRAKTYESSVPADTTNGAVLNRAMQTNWSVVFELPALANDFLAVVLDFISGKSLDVTHLLELNRGNENVIAKTVTIGEINLNAQTLTNATIKVPMYDSLDNYLLCNFSSKIKKYRVTGSATPVINGTVAIYSTSNFKLKSVIKANGPVQLSLGDIIAVAGGITNTDNLSAL